MVVFTNAGMIESCKILNNTDGCSAYPWAVMQVRGNGAAAEAVTNVLSDAGALIATANTVVGEYESLNKMKWTGTFNNTSGSTWSIYEVIVKNATPRDVMLCRHKFTGVKTVENGAELVLTLRCPLVNA
jgi:hypothetical protein